MKLLFIALIVFPVVAHGTDTNVQWYSKVKLENIAKDFAKQHKVKFDFTNAHVTVFGPSDHPLPFAGGETNIARISFDHGSNGPEWMATIRSNGKVVRTDFVIVKTVEPPPP
jgi:hypothetical protein